MTRLRQKKKNRSSVPKVKQKRRTAKNGNRKINVMGNTVIADNWDKKLTLTQNYRRLGLTSRLNAPSGGVEKVVEPSANNLEYADVADPLHTKPRNQTESQPKPAETRVERDPETGKILRVIRDDGDEDETMDVAGRKRRKANPLNDPLEELPDADMSLGNNGVQPSSAVVSALEREAAMQEEALKRRKPRQQSKREVEWLQRLAEKYGNDTRAMARDRKLNPMQQTEADIARRLRKWKAEGT